MKKSQIKQILFVVLIILFLPFAIYTLLKAEFGWFFGGALVVYAIIQISNKVLVNS